FVPALAAQPVGGVGGIEGFDLFDREGIDPSARLAAGRIPLETAPAENIDQGFRHDAARRIAGADEQNVVDLRRIHSGDSRESTGTGRGLTGVHGLPPQQFSVRYCKISFIALKSVE